ncbi:O-methyltransferase family protein [Amycolatopsis mediterranei S699]|uniref:O-methyltransferase family protein n=3 Tax=Amycolatopsis mediterranei TaxID=33910 RepID=A0A0H3D0B4_AMYMU|nr:O-methyltransferase [Amycolatopsis mediterranei]ADJ43634.1 O-methyltransferase family protein [Amycolatopsis mediterranei U32]AEK40342.1 O-methyltransferase family protein [Amycolatopsis mediterranei S699]AFO75346.1 O-methyltransferase family protein [Amycolatopsis mediterranei S699]AGT82475.1 O-methyltransferase family protein [Amycolatopsis mediterranei RB]KDO10274.1 methyltransferase [Amycolatopsis mediterranei]
MTDQIWTEVDDYLAGALLAPDPVLDTALADADAAGLPHIAVAPNQGKLLNLLARLAGARTILEIGTLGGYSTIWLARALPAGGKLVTCEYEPKHAEVAKANLARAGFGEDVVDIRVGAALDTLPTLTGPFDFVFVDADKVNLANYVRASLELARPGTAIVVDNVVRQGRVADAGDDDPNVRGARELFDLLAAEDRIDATAIQTVGGKGYDGFVLALVR